MCRTKKGEEKPSLSKEASAKCIIISVISGLIDPLGTDHESLARTGHESGLASPMSPLWETNVDHAYFLITSLSKKMPSILIVEVDVCELVFNNKWQF